MGMKGRKIIHIWGFRANMYLVSGECKQCKYLSLYLTLLFVETFSCFVSLRAREQVGTYKERVIDSDGDIDEALGGENSVAAVLQ